MKKKIQSLQERLAEIVNVSYGVLCNKIVAGGIFVENEAAFQLQFSVILKTIGQLYEYANSDRFSIELEKVVQLTHPTAKSQKKNARCDIWLSLFDGMNCACAAIELKYFKKTNGETITTNRFALLKDLENLEQYKLEENIQAFEIVYTNNPNYANPLTSSYLNIGNGQKIKAGEEIISNGCRLKLNNDYLFEWDEYMFEGKRKVGGHYFLNIKV